MSVTLQYFDDCPSGRIADASLQDALAEPGTCVVIDHEAVDTIDKAVAARFCRSPSILVDEVDLSADPSHDVGLLCRLYETPDGLQGSPTMAQIVRALTTLQTRS